MKNKVLEALEMLREEGVRIPRSFSNRLTKRTGYRLQRGELKELKAEIAQLSNGDRLVIGVGKDKALSIMSFDTYLVKLKTCKHARETRLAGK